VKRWLILAAAALLFLGSGMASAATVSVNSQGAAGAPLSVTNAAITVLPFSTARFGWTLFPETVDLRCEWGTPANGAPATTPTTTVGFLLKTGVVYSFGSGLVGQHTGNPYLPSAQLRLDCISTGAATSVDTTESIGGTP
jgi:hypothetical protein